MKSEPSEESPKVFLTSWRKAKRFPQPLNPQWVKKGKGKKPSYNLFPRLWVLLFIIPFATSTKAWGEETVGEKTTSSIRESYLLSQGNLGFQPYWVRGNPYKFWEYYRPSPSPYARHLLLQAGGDGHSLEMRVNQPGWLPFSAEVLGGWSAFWRNQFFLNYQQNEFYPRWNPDTQNRILREITWTSRHLATGLRIKGSYRIQSQASSQQFLNPQDFRFLPAYTVQNFSLEGTLPLGNTNLTVSHQTSWFRDRHPFTTGKAGERGPILSSLDLRLEKPFGEAVDTLFYLNLLSGDIPGKVFQVKDQLRKTILGADLVAVPSNHLSLRGRFHRSALRRSTTGLGYYKGGKTGVFDLDYRPLKILSFRGRFEIRDQEFVNRAGRTDTPSWRNWWILTRIKPSSRVQFSFRWTDKEIRNIPSRPEVPLGPNPFPLNPEAEGLPIADHRPLPPNHLQRVEYQLDLRPGDESFITLAHRIDRRKNSYRQLSFTRKDIDLLLWFPLGKRGNLNLNHQLQNFSTGEEFLKPWLSDLRFTSFNLSYSLSDNLILSSSFYRTAVEGATNIRDTSLLLGFSHSLTSSSEMGLQLGWSQFTDRGNRGRGFKAFLFSAEIKRKL